MMLALILFGKSGLCVDRYWKPLHATGHTYVLVLLLSAGLIGGVREGQTIRAIVDISSGACILIC